MKPGYKTTEFWISFALLAAGGALTLLGQEKLGVMLLGIAGFSYTASRGLAKLGNGSAAK